MIRPSFRIIIVLTLVIVIGTISFSSFYIYNHYLNKIIFRESEKNAEFQKDVISAIDLLQDQVFYCNDDHHDGKIINTILDKMERRDQVINSYLYNSEGELMFFLKGDSIQEVPVSIEDFTGSNKEISLTRFPLVDKPFSRAYFHMHNSPTCYECHAPEQEILGYLVIDIANISNDESIAYIKRSSLLFSLTMIFIILGFVLILHYRFIRKSLGDFENTITEINNGNFERRLYIPETKELGLLGKNFNNMLDTFQKTQAELKNFHKKEIRSNYKMATIGEMSARLAHEIRNPITGIANAIEIIVKESNDQDNIPVFEEIQRQAKRVNSAISKLLNYARKKDMDLVMNNINDVIRPLVFFLKSQMKNKQINFELNLQEDIPLLRIDHVQMEDVLLNLGINAIQAIPKKGTVTFMTFYSPVDKRILIEVSDTGKGIKEDTLAQIFHPFFTTRNEGTGLGLAIVKDIIDKHKGEIWVDNNEGPGCTFTISLPVELD